MRNLLRQFFWYGLWFLGAAFYASVILLCALATPFLYIGNCLAGSDVSPAWRGKNFGTGSDWVSPLKILAHLRDIKLPKMP